MPPYAPGYKRKRPQGIGATARAKKAKTVATTAPAFKAAVRAEVKKAEKASHELYYCNWGINYYTGSACVGSGSFGPGGFMAIAGSSASSAAAGQMGGSPTVLNLSPQLQVGTTAGYRKGQLVSPVGFRMYIGGHMQGYASDHTFKFVLARYKGNALPATSVYPQQITNFQSSLFEAGAFGPNASSFSISNDSTSIDLSRYDRDQWDIKKTWEWKVPYQRTAENAATPQTTFRKDCYYKFPQNTVWDYVTYSAGNSAASLSIKGGDYFLIMYQVGNEPSTTAAHSFMVNCELSFHDA